MIETDLSPTQITARETQGGSHKDYQHNKRSRLGAGWGVGLNCRQAKTSGARNVGAAEVTVEGRQARGEKKRWCVYSRRSRSTCKLEARAKPNGG